MIQKFEKRKGQAETPFVLSMAILFSVLAFIAASLATSYPSINLFSEWDLYLYVGSIVGVAAACAIVSGIPCAIALVVGNLITFLTAGNTIMYTVLFLPLSVTVAYVTARLGRAGG